MKSHRDKMHGIISTEVVFIFLVIQMNSVASTAWKVLPKINENELNTTWTTEMASPVSADSLRLLDLENTIHLFNYRDQSQSRKISEMEAQLKIIKSDISLTHSGIERALSTIGSSSQSQGTGFKSALNNCGDVVVGISGYITFRSNLNHSSRTTCTWTIRANTSEKISIKLISDTFDPSKSSLLLVPMWEMRRPNMTYADKIRFQKTIFAGDRNEHTFPSPVLFVSIITNASTEYDNYQPSFILYFEGRGNPDMFSTSKFTHYHYTSNFGEVSYPNGFYYEANEAVSFVINPPYFNPGNFNLTIKYLNLQFCNLCSCDYVQSFMATVNEHYVNWGQASRDRRWCGVSSEVFNFGYADSERWIVVFFSDGDTQGTGFKFSWDKNAD